MVVVYNSINRRMTNMAKTKEELNTLKNEYETVTNKLKELNDDELEYVTGGLIAGRKQTCPYSGTSNCTHQEKNCPYYKDYSCINTAAAAL